MGGNQIRIIIYQRPESKLYGLKKRRCWLELFLNNVTFTHPDVLHPPHQNQLADGENDAGQFQCPHIVPAFVHGLDKARDQYAEVELFEIEQVVVQILVAHQTALILLCFLTQEHNAEYGSNQDVRMA